MTAAAPPREAPPGASVLTLGAGLPGFPAAHRFVLTRWGGDASPFSVLRCLDLDGVEFVVVPPEIFFPDYRPVIDTTTAERLELSGPDDVLILVILTLGSRAADATANLVGPLIINRRTLDAAQVVQSGSGLDLRTPLSAR